MKTKIATLLLIILVAVNFSAGVVYAATPSPETLTPTTPAVETVAPEPSPAPVKTPKETAKTDETNETDKTADTETNDSNIDYTPYLSAIIFLLAGILGVLIGHFVIYRIR